MTQSTLTDNDFAGTWYCRYWYPSNQYEGEDISEYKAVIHQKGKHLIMESLPNSGESYMLARMVVDNDVVTGTWHENTSPHGEFHGTIYSGAIQLLANKARNRIDGKWVGIGQEAGKKHIYSGRWEIVKVSE